MATMMEFSDRRTKLGALVLDILVTEELELPSDVTQYPVEDGTVISDHITQGSERLRISGNVSTADVVAFAYLNGGGQGATKLVDAIDTLRQMHKARALVTVSTGQMLYEDFGFAGMVARRSNGPDGGNWLEIQADLIRIRRVKLKQAEAPAAAGKAGDGGAKGRTGKTNAKAGKSTKDAGAATTGTGTGATPGAGNGLTPANNAARYARGLIGI